MGFIIFEKGVNDGTIYENIVNQLHNTIQRIELLENFQKAEADLMKRTLIIEQLLGPMMESIDYVKSLSERQNENISDMNQRGEVSRRHLQETSEIAVQLESYIKETYSLVLSIDDISETINLVALNASIEASHAGSFGKGFSVIAGEIRKLSEATRNNSAQISSFLANIGSGIENFANANEDTEKAFGSLLNQITEITESLSEVSSKMQELSSSSTSILEAMKQ